MTHSFTGRKRIRKSFGHIPEVTVMPNLIEVQRTSYESFLQMNLRPEERAHLGLQEVSPSGRRSTSCSTSSRSRSTTSRNAISAA
jgi:DNA-directed RNA polymerase subunit beta